MKVVAPSAVAKHTTYRDSRRCAHARTLRIAPRQIVHTGLPDRCTLLSRQSACTVASQVHWHVSAVGSWQM